MLKKSKKRRKISKNSTRQHKVSGFPGLCEQGGKDRRSFKVVFYKVIINLGLKMLHKNPHIWCNYGFFTYLLNLQGYDLT